MITLKCDSLTGITPLDNKHLTGFTLIELIIVGIIVSILVMMSLVSFRGFYRATEFENTVDKIVSFIKNAQTMAVSEWRGKNVVILPDKNKLILELEGDNAEFELPYDYSMESDVIGLSFDGMGGFDCIDAEDSSIAKSSCWIEVKNSDGDEAKIELWGYGGYIKVKSLSLGK